MSLERYTIVVDMGYAYGSPMVAVVVLHNTILLSSTSKTNCSLVNVFDPRPNDGTPGLRVSGPSLALRVKVLTYRGSRSQIPFREYTLGPKPRPANYPLFGPKYP